MSILADCDEMDILIACLMGEAEAEDIIGKIAVGCVIRNRVLDSRWPDTFKDVCLQPKQFSCFNPEFFRPEILYPNHNNIYWRESKFVAWGITNDYFRDITESANLYWNPSIIEAPNWDWSKIDILRTFGHHRFARER